MANRGGGPGGGFEVTIDELQSLMKVRGAEGIELLNSKFGGTADLCKKLKTSQTEGKFKRFTFFIRNNKNILEIIVQNLLDKKFHLKKSITQLSFKEFLFIARVF